MAKLRTKLVKVSFRWDKDNFLKVKVGRRRWDTCIDVCALLADAEVELVLEVRPIDKWGHIKGVQQRSFAELEGEKQHPGSVL